MTADAELLRRYAAEASEEAFAELVRRHLNLVYAAALRQVGDTHRAEEVAQTVFADLARKAASLCRRPVLVSWLYTSTHYAAAKAVRTEQRRQAREREAQTMHEQLSATTPNTDWSRLGPVLDEVMHELGEADRAAVLLRFFKGKAFADVGSVLDLNEDAARKRVARALDNLHGLLARRGITSTSAALATILAGQPAVAAPAGLAAATTAGALAAAQGGAITFLQLMSMTKLMIGIATALVAAGGIGLVLQQQANARLRAENENLLQTTGQTDRLREENRRLAELAAELPGLRAEHAEMLQLREEVTSLKGQLQAATHPPPAGRMTAPGAGKESGASGMVPMADMTNQGRATPRAAGQTVAWAVHHQEIDLAASLITFDPESRAKMEALVAALPPDLRAQYGTPERLMAFVMAGTPRPIAALQVLDETEPGPDEDVQHLQLQYEDGRTRIDTVHFHRTADGWQQVISPSVVDRVANYLNSGSRPPPLPPKK